MRSHGAILHAEPLGLLCSAFTPAEPLLARSGAQGRVTCQPEAALCRIRRRIIAHSGEHS